MTGTVRPMAEADAVEVLRLMRALAAFEHYLDRFQVTKSVLLERAFAPDPDFSVFVHGPQGDRLNGYAVTYWVRWTYTLAPTLVLKELYVDGAMRGAGAGSALFDRVRRQARDGGAGRIEWLVLPGNEAAKSFYRKRGGAPDEQWERWGLEVSGAGA